MSYETARKHFYKYLFIANRASKNARRYLRERDEVNFNAAMAVFRINARHAKHYHRIMQGHLPPRPRVIDVQVDGDLTLKALPAGH